MPLYLSIYVLISMLGMSLRRVRQTIPFAVLVFAFLLLFMGTRYWTGCDFYGYLHRFTNLYDRATLEIKFNATEPAFHALNVAVLALGLDYMWLNVFASLIFLVCLFRFAYRFEYPLLYVALSFPILIVQLAMSGLRQALATGFLMLAYRAFVDRNRLSVALWVLFAAQFHESAYIFLPLALICGRTVPIGRVVFALVVLGPVAAFLLGERFDVYADRYILQIYGENASAGAVLRYGLVLMPALLFWTARARFERMYSEVYPLLWVFALIALVMLPIALVSTVALHRLNYYVLPVANLMLLCAAPIYFGRANRVLGHGLLFALYASYMVVWFSVGTHAGYCYVPYQTYLLK